MNDYEILNRVDSPEDLKRLNPNELLKYCEEARSFLVNSVSNTGGHLASSLGVVELTVALHTVFSSPKDKIVWDVGHQSYTHKLITGRKAVFDTLRQEGGISGFTRNSENIHDAFISGHSSNSISAAIGISTAAQLNDKDDYTIAVIGDGAFTGGLAYEALNNTGSLKNFIVILNHNERSISKNVGAFARYLSTIRSKPSYLRLKSGVETVLDHTPIVGKHLKETVMSSKSFLKNMLYHSTFFEDLGFIYLGPIDGHNLDDLTNALKRAKDSKKPVFLLVDTIKGKGYSFAEENPGFFHGISKFNVETGCCGDETPEETYSSVMGKTLSRFADEDKRICAVTAAMKYGTGLQHFCPRHKDRFFDVGIAEAHAVTFSAGLSAGGMIPVFAVYSTFLQRGYDQIIHDAAIEKQHIVLAIDRAGIVGEDGETHQGIFDTAFLSDIPNVTVFSPSNYHELETSLKKAVYDTESVVAVRYPRGVDQTTYSELSEDFSDYNMIGETSGNTLIITYGRIFENAYKAKNALEKQDKKVSILKLNRISPIPHEAIRSALDFNQIFFFEEGIKKGGIGEHFLSELYQYDFKGTFNITAIDDHFVPQASVASALQKLHLDADSMVEILLQENV
ncbi:MAG: 1-deoxy-D-xylulose-5-phosphate synthase [Oscillospiraceae bacterium]|jgi:1-deoxy-D-xylulose-5-phosphate synthase|nr:1-deoxy-D-xylulose-5-phosphate synthase [Oscillospiraceae bacterium]